MKELEAVAKLHDSGKSMILTSFARTDEVGPVDNFSTMPERAGEKLSTQRTAKGRFYAAKSVAAGSLILIVPSLFLIPVLMLAGKGPVFNYDLLAIVAAGLFFTAKWRIRGWGYVALLLALSGAAKHLWIDGNHLSQICIELSIAFSLLINALVFEEEAGAEANRELKFANVEQSIRYLEEDLTKQKVGFSTEISVLNDKLGASQSVVEEGQSELSAMQILNEVLRNSTASAIESQAKGSSLLLAAESRVGLLLEEVDSLQAELHRLSNESFLVQQNKELFHELNAARFKEAQTQLINETLARMHAFEAQKAQHLEEEKDKVAELELELGALRKERAGLHNDHEALVRTHALEVEKVKHLEEEKGKLAELELELGRLRNERVSLQNEHEALVRTLAEAKVKVAALESELENLRNERTSLQSEHEALLGAQLEEEKRKISELESELAKLRTERANINDAELQALTVELEKMRQAEHLHQQLRDQFNSKNDILHKTRAELFHSDTELQRVWKEIEEKDLLEDPMPFDLRREVEKTEEENAILFEENAHLSELVTHLMGNPVEQAPPSSDLSNCGKELAAPYHIAETPSLQEGVLQKKK